MLCSIGYNESFQQYLSKPYPGPCPPIPGSVDLVDSIRKVCPRIYFITAREESARFMTELELAPFRPYTELIMRPRFEMNVASFKEMERFNIWKQYNIKAAVGDQLHDVSSLAEHAFLLPEPFIA